MFSTCRDDYDDADSLLLLLFLSLNPVFMCVLTEQPSGTLQKQHKSNELASNERDEQSLGRKSKEKVLHHEQLNATVNRRKDKRDIIILRTQLTDRAVLQ